jgi:hypothetical protein
VEERERERGREKEEGGRTIVSRGFLVVSRNAQACVLTVEVRSRSLMIVKEQLEQIDRWMTER